MKWIGRLFLLLLATVLLAGGVVAVHLLRSLPHIVAAGVSILMSLLLAGLPWGTGVLGAAACAIDRKSVV